LDLLVVPPFAEEMNHSRRMFAHLGRKLSALGVGTLVLDLYGTGDSEGEFAQARWEIWRQDLGVAMDWLLERKGAGVGVLGLRLGALLATDFLAAYGGDQHKVLFWQPVLSGRVLLQEFLRLRYAESMMASDRETEKVGVLRSRLEEGETMEVGGYELSPELFHALDGLELGKVRWPGPAELYWMEVVGQSSGVLRPASRRVIEKLRSDGAVVSVHSIDGLPFWAMQETTVVPGLLDETAAVLAGGGRGND